MDNKNKAFTLAEVLITLGIIGIIAAMTIPNLVFNYKKTVYVTTLKKTYSAMTTACERMLAEENVNFLNETRLYRQIKSNADADAIFSTVRNYFKMNRTIRTSEGGSFRGFELLDGTTVIVGVADTGLDFEVDVNGLMNRPNQVGLDRFIFRLDRSCKVQRFTSEDSCKTSPDGYTCFTEVMENNWKLP